jgi:hypothetical protein
VPVFPAGKWHLAGGDVCRSWCRTLLPKRPAVRQRPPRNEHTAGRHFI